jgi:hypothetical protein
MLVRSKVMSFKIDYTQASLIGRTTHQSWIYLFNLSEGLDQKSF